MVGPCSVIEREEQLVLAIRTRTSIQELPQLIGASYQKIWGYMQESGAVPFGPPFVAYFNEDMNDMEVEIGFPVASQVPGKEEIVMSRIPAGKYAAMLYTGPYNKLESAYGSIMEWMNEEQLEYGGCTYEIYLNDPDEVDESELETQILIAVK